MAAELTSGSVVAGYRVDRLIGAGGMGAVYLAYDTTLERRVALKVVTPALAEDTRYRRRFLLEAKLAASLEHPAIVPVYSAGESEGRVYLAMRYLEGGSLGQRLAREGRLPPFEAVPLLAPIADALDAAHVARLVHRDVKPGNILLDGERAYLADFGLARHTASAESLASEAAAQLSGTVGYLAPEQIEGDEITGRTDQYAFACVLFEVLAGSRPYDRGDELAVVYAHLSESPPSLSRRLPALPRAVDGPIARGLAKKPEERFGTCRELVDAVARACGVTTVPMPATRSRRRWVAAALGVGLVVVAAALTAAALARPDDVPATLAEDPPQNAVLVIDPSTGRIADRMVTGAIPSSVAIGQSGVWVLNRDNQTVTRVDPADATKRDTFAIGGTPTGIAEGEGGVWVTTTRTLSFGLDGDEGYTDAVTLVDPVSGTPVERIAVPHDESRILGDAGQVAVGMGYVWVINGDGAVARVDPRLHRVIDVAPTVAASRIAVGDGAVWALGHETLWRIDPTTNGIAAQILLHIAGSAVGLAVGGGAVWIALPAEGAVLRVDPARPIDQTLIETAPSTAMVAYGRAGVWAASALERRVVRIDPATNTVVQAVDLQTTPQALAVGDGVVYAPGLGNLARVGAADGSVDLTTCGPLVAADGRRPDVMILSEFPRTGATGVRGSAIAAIVEFVLRERGFRAGPYDVGYQACDEGTPSGNFSSEKCVANANGIARTPRVVGVVGTYWSPCTIDELSALNPTPTGRVAMVSPVNTWPELTRPGVNVNEPRNFARVVVDDGTQNAAGVVVARALGRRRLYVLATRTYRADWIRDGMTLTAFDQDVEIVGAGSWGQTAQEHRKAVDDVVEAKPGAVFVDGPLTKATGDMLRAIRRRLPSRTVLIARYAFIPVPRLLEVAGDAAVGVYITTPTPPYDGLTERGKALMRRLAAASSGAAVDPWAPLAAQATEVLLEAIARSDGTRDSVSDELLETNVGDGILRPFQIDSNGDITPARFAVMRVTGETPPSPSVQPDFDGAVLDRMITVGPG